MCGICGIIHFNNRPVQEEKIKTMMQKMKHRGPDDEGIFTKGNVGLGFVRLSIIDLSPGGHQPKFSNDGRLVIVFNGEIFNYIEIRDELRKKGYTFNTQSDTEVLLSAYQEWGEDCLDKFNGMWSFVIYDTISGDIFAARDRYGIKPFYYFQDAGHLVFASEIPSILSILENKPDREEQAIFDYLVFNRTDQTENTFFKGIKKLQHGHTLSVKNGTVSIKRWYDLRDKLGLTFSGPDEYRELLTDACSLRLRSDVPVGVCLSGGLDSSTIVSTILALNKDTNLNTFSAVYQKGQHGDESRYIDVYRKDLKNMYFTTPSAESLFEDYLPFIIAHAEPIPSTSPYAQFRLMKLAREHVTVTLDGQGADEQLAGYHYFFGFYYKELLKELRLFRLAAELASYFKVHHSAFGFKAFIYLLLPAGLKTSRRVSERGYLQKDFINRNSKSNTISSNIYSSSTLRDAFLDHFEYKLEHLLKWEDRNSMWFGIEARVPFLDHRLVEQTISLPSRMVIHNGTTKHILRKAMKGILPEEIRMRQSKIGFETPEDEWFRTPKFRDLITDTLKSSSFRNRNIIDPANALTLYQQHLEKKINISCDIWKWLHLELWFRNFID